MKRLEKPRSNGSRKPPLCIYVDNSNIFIGGEQVATARQEKAGEFRIDFINFLS